MGYLATEIIILLAAAAVLGLVIGWALFGLGKPKGVAVTAANPKLEADLKAERDARKKAEQRIVELEAKETNFTDKLQERDTKIAELSHQLDDQAKYRVQSAIEVETREQRIAALEGTLKEREAELAKAASHAHHEAQPIDERLAERDRLIARYKSDLESALTAASPDVARLQQLERENAELRATLVETAGAAPTTSGEKDQIIARLNEEITGLRAAYEAAEQALEEQDAAIDKLTRDLQATQHKLASAEGREVPAAARPKPAPAPVVEPAKPAPAEASEATVAVSLDALVAQIEAKAEAPAPAPAPAADDASESTVAVSLDALVAQIDAKAPAASAPAPAPVEAKAADDANESTVAVSLEELVAQIDTKAEPAAPPVPVAPPAPAKPADDANESTVAVSLEDLVAQIDTKAAPAAPPVPEAPPVPVAPPIPAKPAADDANESTVAVSLEDLVAQIDSKPAPVAPPVPVAPPAPAKPAPADDANESTLAVSLEDLVAQIDAAPAAPAAPPVPAAPAAIDAGESTVAISLADLLGAIDNEPSLSLGVAPAPAGANDDLQRIIGIGPNAASRLQGAGIRTWKQVAELSDGDLEQVAALLKISVDKIKREQWIEQARALLS